MDYKPVPIPETPDGEKEDNNKINDLASANPCRVVDENPKKKVFGLDYENCYFLFSVSNIQDKYLSIELIPADGSFPFSYKIIYNLQILNMIEYIFKDLKTIDECMERLIAVGNAIRCANVGMLDKLQGENIASMVERAILLRKEAGRCKILGERNPKRRQRGEYGSDGAQLVDVTTYDIGKYADRAKDLVDKAEALSARIDRLDIETIVEV